ncbi:MAG: 3-isopropylmalate dehydratase [Rhodothermales bacterium]|nr:3-isopropylmalate dehydratase [Rhodothermales bacterium]
MNKIIRGLAYVVGDAVDTDQIIPAEHLVYSMTEPSERRLYGCYALSSVPAEGQGLPFGNIPFSDCSGSSDDSPSRYSVIIGGSNFGCGSSREHAPFAIAEAGCNVVVADSFARIFFRNAVDGGFLVPMESEERLVERVRTNDDVEVDIDLAALKNYTTGEEFLLRPLGEIADIVRAGSVFEYARQKGLISR